MKFIDRSTDAWLLLPDSEIAGPAPHRLLTLAQWQAVRDAWPAGVPVGVLLPNTVDVEELSARRAEIGIRHIAGGGVDNMGGRSSPGVRE